MYNERQVRAIQPLYGDGEMLISKQNLAILPAVAKSNDNMYSLDCVKIDPVQNCLYASNGHSLYRSNIPDLRNDEYPDTGSSGVDPAVPIVVPGKALAKAEKNLPGRGTASILHNVNVLSTDTHHELITMDLDSVDVVKVKNKELKFLLCEAIEESCTDRLDHVYIGLSVAELEILVRVLKKNGDDIVKFSIKDETSPAIIESIDGVVTAYIMPYELGK